MKIIWKIDNNDIKKVKDFYELRQDYSYVRQRIERNIKKSVKLPKKEDFWSVMIACLLTTQQRSGPKSAVTRFNAFKPFPLNYSNCVIQTNLRKHTENTITNFGGIRRAKTIGEEVSINLLWLEEGGWEEIFATLKKLQMNRTKSEERQAADFIDKNLKGFGPKQARNLLQELGLTRYEIPIDSRIIKWLNSFGFPILLSSAALSDRNYYNLISDGFQILCEKANLYPCVLDAAIFSSFDEEN